jgi:hypothetical protein
MDRSFAEDDVWRFAMLGRRLLSQLTIFAIHKTREHIKTVQTLLILSQKNWYIDVIDRHIVLYYIKHLLLCPFLYIYILLLVFKYAIHSISLLKIAPKLNGFLAPLLGEGGGC